MGLFTNGQVVLQSLGKGANRPVPRAEQTTTNPHLAALSVLQHLALHCANHLAQCKKFSIIKIKCVYTDALTACKKKKENMNKIQVCTQFCTTKRPRSCCFSSSKLQCFRATTCTNAWEPVDHIRRESSFQRRGINTFIYTHSMHNPLGPFQNRATAEQFHSQFN